MKTHIPLPEEKFAALLADPAWHTVTYSKGHHGVPTQSEKAPYATMTVEEMKAIPVGDIAAKDCALFMWVIDSHLDQALKLGAAWGFTYKTVAFVWKKKTKHGKDHIGMGYWSRKQVEMCLLFTRGKPSRIGKGVRQLIEDDEHDIKRWITAKRREHSRKPDKQYERIEALVNGPYCELFARQTREGWRPWGLEAGKFDHQTLEWRDVAQAVGYQVSNDGRVRRVGVTRGKTGKEIKAWIESGTGYPRVTLCEDGAMTKVYVHRLVAEAFLPGRGETVDHINRDKTDNRIENLRWATHSQNIHNRPHSRKDYRGISERREGGWVAYGSAAGQKTVYLGSFDTPEDAAQAYDTYAREKYGDFAQLNFPNKVGKFDAVEKSTKRLRADILELL